MHAAAKVQEVLLRTFLRKIMLWPFSISFQSDFDQPLLVSCFCRARTT